MFPSNGNIKAVKQGEVFHPLVSIWSSSLKDRLCHGRTIKCNEVYVNCKNRMDSSKSD